MTARDSRSLRTFPRWGVLPLFCRGLAVSDRSPVAAEKGATRESRSARQARRARPALWGGILASVGLHAAVVVAWPGAPISLDGILGAERRSAAEREPMRVVELPAPPRAEAPPRNRPAAAEAARPVLRVELPQVAIARVAVSRPGPDLALADRLAGVPGAGVLQPPPVRAGLASDDGGRYQSPIPRSILPTWKPPRSVYGVEVLVRVHTDASGKATGAVELLPPTPDRDTNNEIVYRVRRLDYRPALRNGEPVAAWAEIAFQFCYEGVTASSPPSPTFGSGSPCARGG